MKKVLFVIIALFSVVAFANTTVKNKYLLNKFMGDTASQAQLGTLVDGTRNMLVARYSFAKQGGSTAADINLLTDLTDSTSLAVLPARAIVTNVWVDVLTAVTSSSTATMSVKAIGAGDLMASKTKGQLAVGFVQGVPAGTTTTFLKLPETSKTVKATVSTTALTAGKFDVYIEYVKGGTTASFGNAN